MNTNSLKKNKNKNDLTDETQIRKQNSALINQYNYYNSINKGKWLPTTSIFEYMKREYKTFYEELVKIRAEGNELSLDDFFIVPNNLTLPQTKCSFETNLEQNPNMSFDKFISIIDWLLNVQKHNIYQENVPIDAMKEAIKNQINKDLSRTSIIEINNIEYFNNKESNIINKFNFIILDSETESIDKNTDLFNNQIMNIMKSEGILINFNIITIIDILVQQNIATLIQMLIELLILQKIKPETASSTQFDRSIQIYLTKEDQYILLNFKSQILLTKEGELIETPCGNYSCTLRVDLKNKNYSLDNFTLNYDLINCGSEVPISPNNLSSTDNNSRNASQPSSINNYKNKAFNFIKNNKGPIAAGVAASGLISVGALFLTGVLGGKKFKTKKHRNYNEVKKRKLIKKKKLKKTKKSKTKKSKTKKYRIL